MSNSSKFTTKFCLHCNFDSWCAFTLLLVLVITISIFFFFFLPVNIQPLLMWCKYIHNWCKSIVTQIFAKYFCVCMCVCCVLPQQAIAFTKKQKKKTERKTKLFQFSFCAFIRFKTFIWSFLISFCLVWRVPLSV